MTDANPAGIVIVPEGPVPAIAGTFAIYEDGSGGYVLVTDTTEHGTMRKHIPATIVKLMGGKLGSLFRKDG